MNPLPSATECRLDRSTCTNLVITLYFNYFCAHERCCCCCITRHCSERHGKLWPDGKIRSTKFFFLTNAGRATGCPKRNSMKPSAKNSSSFSTCGNELKPPAMTEQDSFCVCGGDIEAPQLGLNPLAPRLDGNGTFFFFFFLTLLCPFFPCLFAQGQKIKILNYIKNIGDDRPSVSQHKRLDGDRVSTRPLTLSE